MKKLWAIFSATVLAVSMTACGGQAPSSSLSAASSAAPQPSSTSENSSAVQAPASSESSSTVSVSSQSSPEASSVASEQGGKTLVVYFSRTGNTRALATEIQSQTNADIFEIKTVRTYSEDYQTATEEAKKEQTDKARPELSTTIDNIADYDTVFIGYPIWWSDMPMAIYTFLDTYDLSGKKLLPFCTHGGSGISSTPETIAAAEPNATVTTGLSLGSSAAANSKQAVTDWLKETGIEG